MADNSTSKSGKNSATGKPFTAFEQAFFNARKAGDKTFTFRGKDYTTKLKSEHLLVDPPTPKPSAGSDTRNQSPPGPQDRDLYGTAEMSNPPTEQPTPQDIAQEQAVRPPPGGALGLQGPGNPAAAPGPPPGAASAPPGPDLVGTVPGGPGAYNTAVAPPGGAPAAQGGPHPQFDAELAAFQQRQAQAMQGQLAQPAGNLGPGQGSADQAGVAGVMQGAAQQFMPGQGGDPTGGTTAAGGNLGMGQGGAIDFQGLARYFYQLGMQAASATKGADNLGTGRAR